MGTRQHNDEVDTAWLFFMQFLLPLTAHVPRAAMNDCIELLSAKSQKKGFAISPPSTQE